MKKATGSPVFISSAGASTKLERIQLGAGTHDEAWLQDLIFRHPELIPVSQIEPGFGVAIPAAREVACGHGYIDNLYVTPGGEIILVETKLWRNVQARREVVAQALDYVSALMCLGYEGFEAAVTAASQGQFSRLYELVEQEPEALDEAAFIDAVSKNLLRGRMLVIALGDGIRREAEALASLLQSHAGAHFTFALVELATWRCSNGDLLAVPNTLAQTSMIERGILLFNDGIPSIKAIETPSAQKPKSISEDMFYEELAKGDPKLPAAIKAFLKLVEPLGVYADQKASLNLKADLPEGPRPTNFGYIGKNGQLWTNPLSWTVPDEVARGYNQTLADLIGGKVATHDNIYLSSNGTSAPQVGELLPQHAEAWAQAIRRVIEDVRGPAAEAAE